MLDEKIYFLIPQFPVFVPAKETSLKKFGYTCTYRINNLLDFDITGVMLIYNVSME